MAKKKKDYIQFRYYEVPQNEPVLALTGQTWVREYGVEIGYLHFHNLLEIGICYYGNGDLIIEDTTARFGEKMISFIPKNILHTTNCDVGTKAFWEYLFIDVEGFLEKHYGKKKSVVDNLIKSINRKAIFIKEEDNDKLSNMVKEIFEEMKNKDKYYCESVNGIVLSMLIELARINENAYELERNKVSADLLNNEKIEDLKNVKTTTTNGNYVEKKYDISFNKQSKVKENIKEAIEYMDDNFEKEIKVGELAEMCHISEPYFRKAFFEYTNLLPNEYLNVVRIHNACEYIKKGYDSMSEVAFKVGYSTQSTFNRNFKKYMGVTPNEWRNHPENYESKLLRYRISTYDGW